MVERMEKRVEAIGISGEIRAWLSGGLLSLEERAIVKRARALIGDARRWTRLKFASDAQGESVDFSDPRAERFCAVGALERAAFEISGNREYAARAAKEVQEKLHGKEAQ